jgi:signal transduction histidine kinase
MLARVMQEEARRVNGIIRQFLSFARPQKLQRQPVSVRELVDHVGSLFSAQAADKGVVFTASTDGSRTAHLDSEQITQALLNVLQNALEATPRGGQIILKGNAFTGGTQFTVTDTGNGIPPILLDKIFNLYFTTKAEGTGLGLSITQQIIGQHDGTIDVSSVVGKGTVFTLKIPDPPA